MRARVSSLANLPLFQACPRSELQRIESLLTAVRLESGTTLIRQGDAGREFIVIGQGTARVTRTEDGAPVELAQLGPGSFVGEMALLADQPRSATVVATSDMVALVSNAREFHELTRISPSVGRQITWAANHRSLLGPHFVAA